MIKKILVVDDEPHILRMTKMRLEKNNYYVITASNGLEAMVKAHNENPDLIILDLMLPKVEGYKICAMLKFDKRYKHIPIIIVSARSNELDKKIGVDVGADAYIIKPANPEELLHKISVLLKEKPETQEKAEEIPLEDSQAPQKPIDKPGINKTILLIEDDTVITKLVTLRLRLRGYDIISARDGKDGLSLAQEKIPDLIILDIMIPKMDGYQVCTILKNNPQTQHIPVIIFTGRTLETDKAKAKEVGADAYITKPFDAQILLDKIDNLIKDSSQ